MRIKLSIEENEKQSEREIEKERERFERSETNKIYNVGVQ